MSALDDLLQTTLQERADSIPRDDLLAQRVIARGHRASLRVRFTISVVVACLALLAGYAITQFLSQLTSPLAPAGDKTAADELLAECHGLTMTIGAPQPGRTDDLSSEQPVALGGETPVTMPTNGMRRVVARGPCADQLVLSATGAVQTASQTEQAFLPADDAAGTYLATLHGIPDRGATGTALITVHDQEALPVARITIMLSGGSTPEPTRAPAALRPDLESCEPLPTPPGAGPQQRHGQAALDESGTDVTGFLPGGEWPTVRGSSGDWVIVPVGDWGLGEVQVRALRDGCPYMFWLPAGTTQERASDIVQDW